MGCTGLDLGSQQVWFGHSGKKGMSFGRSWVMAHGHCRCTLSSRDIADAIQVEVVLLVSFATFRDMDFFFFSFISTFSLFIYFVFLFFYHQSSCLSYFRRSFHRPALSCC